MDKFFDDEFEQHALTLQATREAVRGPFGQLVKACREALAGGGKILFCGNGGSAADAQHLATELVVRYTRNRKALPSIALTTDTSLLTAAANDFSFDEVFARQVEALCRPGDVVIGISTSGNSPNVLRALEAAKEMGGIAAGLSGRDGGKMVGLAEPLIVVPSTVTARIQEMHILLGHMLCDLLEAEAV
ncbi:D-sedoheptulose 7-phosphate isomerase [Telmatospirillum sp. J64-1]|uniref:D-sedoheptulose 7-phosphate isomerase n=1 Tax=Telmatospirillum sp. J64-1 TaxID=2502183 RepID=UPI002105D35D|nr:D-sedoheptulose 7-phosphate isomerase [Telmatospirillum sp. J64-1]